MEDWEDVMEKRAYMRYRRDLIRKLKSKNRNKKTNDSDIGIGKEPTAIRYMGRGEDAWIDRGKMVVFSPMNPVHVVAPTLARILLARGDYQLEKDPQNIPPSSDGGDEIEPHVPWRDEAGMEEYINTLKKAPKATKAYIRNMWFEYQRLKTAEAAKKLEEYVGKCHQKYGGDVLSLADFQREEEDGDE